MAHLEPLVFGSKSSKELSINLGVSFNEVVRNSSEFGSAQLADRNGNFIIRACFEKRTSPEILVAYFIDATNDDVLRSYFQCCMLGEAYKQMFQEDVNTIVQPLCDSIGQLLTGCSKIEQDSEAATTVHRTLMEASRKHTEYHFPRFIKNCVDKGWIVDKCQLGPGQWRSKWKKMSTKETE